MAVVRPRQGRDNLVGFRIRRFHLRLFTVLPSGQLESMPRWRMLRRLLRHVRSAELGTPIARAPSGYCQEPCKL
jgi:hypothetical protein